MDGVEGGDGSMGPLILFHAMPVQPCLVPGADGGELPAILGRVRLTDQ